MTGQRPHGGLWPVRMGLRLDVAGAVRGGRRDPTLGETGRFPIMSNDGNNCADDPMWSDSE